MHDLYAMYKKSLDVAFDLFDEVTVKGNFFKHPRPSKMSDLEVIALAVAAESTSIDSENLLFAKLRSNYLDDFPQLISRSRFNRRRRSLKTQILELAKRISMTMGMDSDIDLVDSVPCPIVRNSRERTFKICKENPEFAPRKGYSAVDKRYYIGYKLHLLTNENGVFQDMQITPANVHDINFLKDLEPEYYTFGKTIIGDRGYISSRVQVDLFQQYEINLEVPYRRNQQANNTTARNLVNAGKRRRIETQFSQLCDQFRLKHNYAKTFLGFFVRIVSKIAAMTLLQKVNIEKGRPLNHIKHAWS